MLSISLKYVGNTNLITGVSEIFTIAHQSKSFDGYYEEYFINSGSNDLNGRYFFILSNVNKAYTAIYLLMFELR